MKLYEDTESDSGFPGMENSIVIFGRSFIPLFMMARIEAGTSK